MWRGLRGNGGCGVACGGMAGVAWPAGGSDNDARGSRTHAAGQKEFYYLHDSVLRERWMPSSVDDAGKHEPCSVAVKEEVISRQGVEEISTDTSDEESSAGNAGNNGSGDEEPDAIQKRALAVEGEPDWSMEGPPATAEEYLRRVRWEAAQCPSVMRISDRQKVRMQNVAEIDGNDQRLKYGTSGMSLSSRSIRASSIQSSKTTEKLPLPPKYTLPDAKWQRALVASFSDLRLKIASALSDEEQKGKQSGVARDCHTSEKLKSTLPTLPSMRDPDSWRRFCIGDNVDPQMPTMQLMCRLGEAKVSLLLQYAVQWLQNDIELYNEQTDDSEKTFPLTPKLSSWLFSLCASVGKPLSADTCASIRSMYRHCSILRSRMPADDATMYIIDNIARVNTLITISGQYFRQAGPDDYL